MPPDARVQRTRSSASPPYSPLTRYPFGVGWKAVLGAALLVCLPAFGDSPRPDSVFVFDNRGGNTALVSYTLKQTQPWPAVTVPAVARSPQGEGGWRELRPSEYLTSGDGRTKTITVRAGESLRLAVVKTYPGHGMKGLWMFPIDSIQLADVSSKSAATVCFAGCEALLSFERWSDTLYVFQVEEAKGVPPI